MNSTVIVDGEPDILNDPLRSYVITLRKGQKLSQEDVAEKLGKGRRTYIAWETGETKDLKLPVARSLVRILDGAFEHLGMMDELSADEARELAEHWLKMSPGERGAARTSASKLRRVVELAADDPQRLDDVIRQLRNDARADPAVLDLIAGYLAGLRASRSRGE
jgi:transcriptional regulator with XRE-family HTH domain